MSFYRVLLRQLYRTREMQNEFHIEDATSLLTQEAIANSIIANWIPPFRAIQCIPNVYFQIQVTRILTPDPLATYTASLNIIPTASLTCAVGFETYKLDFHSALLGSRHRGRYFIAGIAQGFTDLSSESIGPSGLTILQNIAFNIHEKYCEPNPTTGLNLVIAHKNNSTPTRVETVTVDPVLTFLRSRKRGVGI